MLEVKWLVLAIFVAKEIQCHREIVVQFSVSKKPAKIIDEKFISYSVDSKSILNGLLSLIKR